VGGISYLLTATKTQDQVQLGLFLDIVVRQGAAVFQLLASKDQSLVLWRHAFFVPEMGGCLEWVSRGLTPAGE